MFPKAEAVTEISTLAEQFRAAAFRLELLATCAPRLELGTLRRQMNAVRIEVSNALTGDDDMADDAVTGEQCPACGSTRTVGVVWGEPTAEQSELARRGEAVLGGCLVHGDGRDPARECRDCGQRFGSTDWKEVERG